MRNPLDLLHPTPTCTIDHESTRLSLALAFAGGTAGGLFGEALERAAIAPSYFNPGEFAGELFLQRFIAQCFKIRLGQHEAVLNTRHLGNLISHPPAEPSIIDFRRQLLAELVRLPACRKELARLYQDLCRLRGLLENAGALPVFDANRRKLDILRTAKSVFDRMATGFAGASSGLRRLAEYGGALQASEPYLSLADLLRYDARFSTVNVRLGIGADGRVSGFQIVSTSEDAQNPFVNSLFRRWLAKLELFVRGYRFSDVEVLARLIDSVFSGLEDEFVGLVQLLGDVEFYLGALGFRDIAEAAGLSVCLPEFVAANEPRSFSRLFNPLLLMSGVVPVPCDVGGAPLASTVLVTGPNSGGKTRLLQSLGLAQVLAQCGLFVPARHARMALASGLLASLIEEAKADQAEGRLGTELLRIRRLFERLPPGALVLLDELCSGTNPSEGEQIFELVVSMLNRLKPQAFITTHFLSFASGLEKSRKIPSLSFLQVELDADRKPTYQFAPGVAKSSLAGHTAERLGVTGDQLLQLIEQNIQKRAHGAFFAAT